MPNGYLKGKPYRIRVSNGAGQLFAETTTTYAADADGVAPFYTPPQQIDTSICDATACGKQTRIVYSYDSYGNVTREDRYGDIAEASDDRTAVRTFSPNTTAWLVGQPTSETIYQGIGLSNQMASTSFYYAVTYPDNSVVTNSFDGPLLQAVAEGSLNHIQYAGFNALGQPGTATFGNGVVTTYTYATTRNGTCPQQTFRLCTLKTLFARTPPIRIYATASIWAATSRRLPIR